MCVYSLRNPACKAHASHCCLWHLGPYCILQYYLIIGTIFENKIAEHKIYVFILSKTFV